MQYANFANRECFKGKKRLIFEVVDNMAKRRITTPLGYSGPEWQKKVENKDHPNFWKYGVANIVFKDLVMGKKKILDIGCGTGGSTLFLAGHARLNHIVGVDLERSMIEVARRQASHKGLSHKVDFVICDGMCLPFRQACFNALVSRGDAFVFLVPQRKALLGFKEVLKSGAVVVVEIDNVGWKPGRTISRGFERMKDGTIAYFIERFAVSRNHIKTFRILDPKGKIAEKIRANKEFARTGGLKQHVALSRIKKETVETRQSASTHWPSTDEMKKLFIESGFKKIQILGNGLLMSLFLQGNDRIKSAMKEHPDLFFEIERQMIPFIDPERAGTIIVKAVVR